MASNSENDLELREKIEYFKKVPLVVMLVALNIQQKIFRFSIREIICVVDTYLGSLYCDHISLYFIDLNFIN